MSHSRLRLLGGLGALALTAVPAAQAPAPQNLRDATRPTIGTAVIAGTLVTDDEAQRPIRHALVSLSGGDMRDQRSTATDDRGQFLFSELPAGHYSVSASKPGYCSAFYGAKVSWRGPSSPVTLDDGQRATVAMKMLHGAVIAGTIFDAFGRPQPGVRVSVSAYRTVGGVRRLEPFFVTGPGSSTDDLGGYRVYGLAPGDYAVIATVSAPTNTETRLVTNEEIQWAQRQLQRPGQATAGTAGVNPPPPGPATGYAPIYFPGTADPGGATTITLAASEERDGVDFPLQGVATAKLSGTIADVEGRPAASIPVTLVAKQMLPALMPFSGRGQSDGRGNFSFPGVTPGEYTIIVRSAARGEGPAPGSRTGGPASPRPILWAEQELTVHGEDITGLSLRLQPALSVSGRLVFEGATPPPPDLSKVRLGLGPAPSTGATTTTITMGGAPEINPDGTFTMTGATPGRYRLNASVPAPPSTSTAASTTPTWVVQSVLSGGMETLDSALEISTGDVSGVVITFTDHPTELSGRLLDSKGKPTPEYWVVTFTTDRAFWTPGSRRVRTMRPDADGKFRIVGLPSGEYYMVALTDLDQADMSDTTFLEQLAAASLKIRLADGEKKAQDLKLSGGSAD